MEFGLGSPGLRSLGLLAAAQKLPSALAFSCPLASSLQKDSSMSSMEAWVSRGEREDVVGGAHRPVVTKKKEVERRSERDSERGMEGEESSRTYGNRARDKEDKQRDRQ